MKKDIIQVLKVTAFALALTLGVNAVMAWGAGGSQQGQASAGGAIGRVAGQLGSHSIHLLPTWTGPTQSPPNGNVFAPINTSLTNQVKDGGLGLSSLSVFGNSIFSGNVGIGVTNPTQKLDVSGNVQTTGFVKSNTGMRSSKYCDVDGQNCITPLVLSTVMSGLTSGSSSSTGGSIPSGFVEKPINLGGDSYPAFKPTPPRSASLYWYYPHHTPLVDTCDGNNKIPYSCPVSAAKICRDVQKNTIYLSGIFSGGTQIYYNTRTVTCRKEIVLVKTGSTSIHGTKVLTGSNLFRQNREVDARPGLVSNNARQLCRENFIGSHVASYNIYTHGSSCGGTYNTANYSGGRWGWLSIGCGSRIKVFRNITCKR